jgi:hypothetical protein
MLDGLFLASIDKPVMAALILGVAASFGALTMVLSFAHSFYRTKQHEQSRREVAAYVAEGSMSPEDAERILTAEPDSASMKRCWHT